MYRFVETLKHKDMTDLIINYNHNNRMYKKTGIEEYNNYCIKIIKQVYKLSQNQIDIFNKNTSVAVFETC